jgi:hypothetical protein
MVGVGRFGDSSLRKLCEINVSVLARERMRQDKALPKDKAETMNVLA